MTHVVHHYHKRKRIYQNYEPYPHPDKTKRVMDKIMYVVGIVGPVMTIPQTLDIFMKKSAAGLSFISWFTYFVLSFFWLAYSIMHREKPLILTSVLWIFLHFLIVIGILMYG